MLKSSKTLLQPSSTLRRFFSLRPSRCGVLSGLLTLSLGLGLSACEDDPKVDTCDPISDPACSGQGIGETGASPTTSLGDILGEMTNGGDGQGTCEKHDFVGSIQPANVMLVLDKSGSMTTRWMGIDNQMQSRWESLYRTVEFMLTEFQYSVRFGMKLFPSTMATDASMTCDVPAGVDVEIADQNGAQVLAAMPKANANVQGGTPASTGLSRAVEYLKGLQMAGDQRKQIVILVMDGRVTDCEGNDHVQMLDIAQDARKNGILTFVVGIDVDPNNGDGITLGVELNELAQSGGTDTYYDSRNAELLRSAMSEIVNRISDCRIDLVEAPMQPNWATVSVNGVDHRWIQGATSCREANLGPDRGGFVYVDRDGKPAVELCGKACGDYISTGKASVNLLCEPPA